MPPAELVRFNTSDGLELHGALFRPKSRSRTVIIHIHGWIGNFYENKFIEAIAQKAAKQGVALLSFNNRGTGIVSDLIARKKHSVKYRRIGGSLERFQDCVIDISAAITFLRAKGFSSFILQGHSLGCQKAVYFMSRAGHRGVKALILLSPVDDVKYVRSHCGKKYEANLAKAKAGKLLPSMQFYPMITPEKFLDVADPQSVPGRLLDYSGKLAALRKLKVPLLVILGSDDEYDASPEESIAAIRKAVPTAHIEMINESGHVFAGFEREVSGTVSKWLKRREFHGR